MKVVVCFVCSQAGPQHRAAMLEKIRDAYEDAHITARATAKEIESFKLEREKARARARAATSAKGGARAKMRDLLGRAALLPSRLASSGRSMLTGSYPNSEPASPARS